MNRRSLYDYFFILFLCTLLYAAARLLLPFAGALLTALLCANTFYPVQKAIHRRFPKLSLSVRAAIGDLLVFLFFITPVILLCWALVQESTSLLEVVKKSSDRVTQWTQGQALESAPALVPIRLFFSKVLGIHRAQIQENIVEAIHTALEYISFTGTLLAKHAVLLFIDLMIMLFALFFLFRDGESWWTRAQDLIPIRQEQKHQLVLRVQDAMTGIARGLFLTSLAQGLAATIGFLLVGAEGAVLLGAMTAATGLLPLIGTLAIWVPAGIFFLLNGLYFKGIFILLWGAVVIVGLMDVFVRPYLVGNKMELPTGALFFALLGGAEVWGAKGLILGPLLFALVPVLLDIYRANYLRKPGKSEDPAP